MWMCMDCALMYSSTRRGIGPGQVMARGLLFCGCYWEKQQIRGAGMLGAVALLGNTAAGEGGRNFDWGGYELWLVCQE